MCFKYIFLILTIVCAAMSENILALFTTDKDVIELGALILRYQCISIPFMGWIIMSGMFLQNIGQFKNATIVSAARQGILFIPLILIIPHFWGIYGVMLVQPISDLGTFIISVPMVIKQIRSMNSEIKV